MLEIDDGFLEPYKTKQPDWGPVGEITYRRTYARDGEEWWQTCKRVVEGCYYWQREHCKENNRPWADDKAQYSMQQMYALIFDMKFLPPGRGLWSMGTNVLVDKGGAAANNCGFVSTKENTLESFCWAMDMLMLGVGVGFDTLGAEVQVGQPLPPAKYAYDLYQVEDSREGWVEALRRLLSSYLTPGGGICVGFDYRKIRPRGAEIKGFGGTASGHEPLKEMLEAVRSTLYKRIGKELGSTAIVDIMNLVGRCVVAGNVRRSAEIALGSPLDGKYMKLKDPELFPAEVANHRWAANHSVVCERGENYERLVNDYSGVSELGVFWLDNARKYARMGRRPDNSDYRSAGCNPCAEQTLEDRELCCLVEVFPSRHDDYYELQHTLKYAYLYAKTVTTIPIHDETTQKIVKRNRRIGCSMTGIQDAIAKHGHKEFYRWCSEGYKYLKAHDQRYSSWLGIPKSIKLTSVKPSGTVSKLPGVTSGIHFPPAKYYYQVIRFDSDSRYPDLYRDAGYRVYDLAPAEPNTIAVYFPIKVEHFSRSERDVTAWEQLEHSAKLQYYWADNQVSVTVKYQPHERAQIPAMLHMYEDRLKAVSFLPQADHGFEHAPWQPMRPEEYDNYVSSLTHVSLSGNMGHEANDIYCDGEACTITKG